MSPPLPTPDELASHGPDEITVLHNRLFEQSRTIADAFHEPTLDMQVGDPARFFATVEALDRLGYNGVEQSLLVLLDEYERWTGDRALVRDLEREARAAINWIDEYADLMGNGYISYKRRNEKTGLENQSWKDSWNSISYADGRLPAFPRATCELQGYAYDAKMRAARLARLVWHGQRFELGVFYAANQGSPVVRSVLAGIGAAAVGLLASVTLQIGGKQLQHLLDLTIVAITVMLVSVFHVPLLVVLVTVGPVAIYLYRPHPARPLAPDSTGLDKKPAD